MNGQTQGQAKRRHTIKFSLFTVTLLSAAFIFMSCKGTGASSISFPPGYQAVFLDNGQTFFGKLSDTTSDFPLLEDVFYVAQVNPDNKGVKNILIKRGEEWHSPSFMRINAKHIVLIEPVSEKSRVMELINEANKPKGGSQ
jgi:hypothetical protein